MTDELGASYESLISRMIMEVHKEDYAMTHRNTLAAERGETIRQLIDAQASALDALGKRLDRFDRVVLAHAAVDVLWPTTPVDMPSWEAK